MASTRFPAFTMSMKTTQKNLVRLILAGLFIAIGAGHTMADPAWVRHNSLGWYDAQGRYHLYVIQPLQGNSPGLPERSLSDTAAAL